ncbi:C-type lectin 37Da [Drosophila willistoni]|nr:C-type lectin 37Da [Drosophila willistoni]
MTSALYQTDINANLTIESASDEPVEPGLIFSKIGNKHYFIETKERKNWFDAYATCRQMGAYLIAFKTDEEWRAITNYLYNGNTLRYWTAGTDLIKEDNHIWFPTSDPITLSIWYPGEPNNHKGLEHCDELRYYRSQSVGLNDYYCDSENLFICELP